MKDREQRIRELAYRIWEESGRPPDEQDRHWQAARQILTAQDPGFANEAPTTSLLSISERPVEVNWRTFDEIVADAQKAVARSLREAFDAGRAHTASELKRRMATLFEGL